MRRWNGWGDTNIDYPLPDAAVVYLAAAVGPGSHLADTSYEQTLAMVPPAKNLPPHPLIVTQVEDRLQHACGQSLPDWVALRGGQVHHFPDGVAYPTSAGQVRSLIDYAQSTGTRLIPYGGGTSVVGHLTPLPGNDPVLTIDLSLMNQLIDLNERDHLATFQAGVAGPQLENSLNQRGFTLGHFPQSFEYSSLGGWIATRSSGQQSYYYGRIEELFAGGHLETPIGPLELPVLPASAAGPDLRQITLGSEGRLGVITSASVRVRALPEFESFQGIFFRDWQAGIESLHEICQEKSCVSMLRLSDADETQTTLILADKKLAFNQPLTKWANRGLSVFGFGPERCLLVFAVTGQMKAAQLARKRVTAIARANRGLPVGEVVGKLWRKSRFLTPYLRNTLWDYGYALDTLETALSWSKIPTAVEEIKQTLRRGLDAVDEQVLVFAHLSHVYRDGASLYVTYLFRRSSNPQETISRWKMLKTAASQVIVNHGGTISHQHGVGLDHAPYLAAEKGPVGMAILQGIFADVDPQQIMNQGKLIS